MDQRNVLLAATAMVLLLPHGAEAAEAAEVSLDTVVVTAGRAPERLDQVGSQITVLDSAFLRAQQTPVVSEVLSRTPGVSMSRNGGVGGATQVRIRGAETDHTVVLIDGVKLNDPSATGGGYNFANLLAGDIARAEILRGPQSVLWGSQAIGGVVNLLTADPASALEGQLQAEAGSLGTLYARAAAGGKGERVTWRLAGGYFTSRGVSQFDARSGGAERDGNRNVGVSGKVRAQLAENVSLDLRSVYSRNRNEIDGFAPPAFTFGDTEEYGVTKDWVTYAGVNVDLADGRLANRVAYQHTRTDRDNFNPAQAGTTRTFDAAGQNERFEYQGQWRFNDRWSGVFGAEHERSSFRSASPTPTMPKPQPGRGRARLQGAYGAVRGEMIPGLTVGAGVRVDDHDDFGVHIVGQASAAYVLGGDTVLRASFGEGFKAPTLFQLHSDFGNSALAPEAATAWDAGVERHFLDDRLVVQAAYFNRKTTDQIEFVSCAASSTLPLCTGPNGLRRSGYYENIARTTAHGLEFQGSAQLTSSLEVSANYTWTIAENDSPSSPNRGKRLARRPANQAYAETTWRPRDAITATVAVRYFGDSYDDAANRNLNKGAVVWDMRVSWAITPRVELYGRVENLTDTHYQTIRNYGQPGRTVYAGARTTF